MKMEFEFKLNTFSLSIKIKKQNLEIPWSIQIHHYFPKPINMAIKTILILSRSYDPITKEPKYPQSFFYKLPKPILFILFQFIASK